MKYNKSSREKKDNSTNLDAVKQILSNKSTNISNSRSESLLSSYYKSKPLLRNISNTVKTPSFTRLKKQYTSINNNSYISNSRLFRISEAQLTSDITTEAVIDTEIIETTEITTATEVPIEIKTEPTPTVVAEIETLKEDDISIAKTLVTDIEEYDLEDKVKAIRTKKSTSISKYKDVQISNNKENDITPVITPSSSIPIKRKTMDDSTKFPNLSLYTQYKFINKSKSSLMNEINNKEIIMDDNQIIIKKDQSLNDQGNNYDSYSSNAYDNDNGTYCDDIDNHHKNNNVDDHGDVDDNNNEDDNNSNIDINNSNDNRDNFYVFLSPMFLQEDINNYNHLNDFSYTKTTSDSTDKFNTSSQLHNDLEVKNDNIVTQYFNPEIVIKKESYVDRLSDDTLYEIFKLLSNTSDFSKFASVCRRWNKIVIDPYLWRHIYYNWTSYVHQHQLINQYYIKHKRLPLPLNYIWKMNIENNYDLEKLPFIPAMPLFENLKELHLSYFYLDDILDLILTMPDIETLRCYQIMTRLPVESLTLTAFATLKKLKVLELEFKEICEHIRSASLTNDRRVQFKLSSTLRILNVKNICDIEEAFFVRIFKTDYKRNELTAFEINRIIRSWTNLEDELLRKYQFLDDLHCLDELSLGYCRGFTAKVWRECIQPCTKSLKKLILYGWNNNGYLENPKKRLERRLLFDMVNNENDRDNQHHSTNNNNNINNEPVIISDHVEDVEKAVMETIESLQSVEYLSFNEFQCGYGLIHGLKSLSDSKSLTIHYLSLDDDNTTLLPYTSIQQLDLLLNTCVNKLDILVVDK